MVKPRSKPVHKVVADTEDSCILDKRVSINLAMIAAILAQAFTFGWFAATFNSRLDNLEKAMAGNAAISTRVAQVEGKVDLIQNGVQDIKKTIGDITTVQVRTPVSPPPSGRNE